MITIRQSISTSIIRKRLSALFAFLFLTQIGYGQALLQWNTFGNAGTETTEPSVFNNAGIGAANLTLGAGVIPTGNANRLGGDHWYPTGATSITSLSDAINDNHYIQFIVTPSTGFSFTPTALVFKWERSSTGPSNLTLRSSSDNFVSDLGTAGVATALNDYTISISGLSKIATATTFRLYGYGASSAPGSAGFDQPTTGAGSNVVNVQLNGTTCSTAEINVQGFGYDIPDGNATTSAANLTSFSSVHIGGNTTRTFTIQNLGTSALSITGTSVLGTNASEFSISAAPSTSVAAAGSTMFTVKFTPAGTGTRSAVIHITNADCDEGDYDFVVAGTGRSYTDLYVDAAATGSNNGSSWADAFTDFQSALSTATAGDIVYVAQGTYKPGIGIQPSPTARTNTFTLSNGVTYYGGFPAGGGNMASRDFTAYRTILSGDIGAANVNTDNCFVVVNARNLTSATMLSGFTVELGYSDSTNSNFMYGQSGGINLGPTGAMQLQSLTVRNNYGRAGAGTYAEGPVGWVVQGCAFDNNTPGAAVAISGLSSGSFTGCAFTNNVGLNGGAILQNVQAGAVFTFTACSFTGNSGTYGGGGGAINAGNAANTFTSCSFTNNSSVGAGGALNKFYATTNTFSYCTFTGNSGYGGGALYGQGGFNIDHCVFSQNYATGSPSTYSSHGGAIYNNGTPSTITNTVFRNNAAQYGAGGAIYNNTGGTMNLTNCTFTGNNAGGYSSGGALNNNSTSNANISNCIFWGNTANGGHANADAEIVYYSGTLNVSNTIWQGNSSGGTIYNADPLFTNTTTGDLSLQDCSPAIDAGAANSLTTDVAGNTRPVDNFPGGGTYDIGAYEKQTFPVLPEINVLQNAASIADGTPAASALNFGNGPSSLSFTIQNTGGAALSVTGISITGTNAGDFSVTTNPVSPVAMGTGSTTFTIAFNPGGVGSRTAIIHVNNSDCDEGDYDFAVQGTGLQGGALDFDGVDDYVSLGTSATLRPTAALTVEAWVYNANWTIPQYSKTVVGNTQNGGYALTVQAATGQMQALVRANGNYGTAAATTTGLSAGWHHFAMTYDGRYTQLYIDGNSVSSSDAGGNFPIAYGGAATPVILGGEASANATPEAGRYFAGAIDEVRIWNRALCQVEIQNNMNGTLPNSTTQQGLLLYYNMNQGVASGNNTNSNGGANITALTDASASGISGSLSVGSGFGFARTGSSSNFIAGSVATTVAPPYLAPEINLQGGSANIADGATSTGTGNKTDFGNVAVGSPVTNTYTIQNTGNAVLILSGLTASGGNAAEFVVSALPASVPAATISGPGTTSFTITFTPAATGLRSTTIHIANGDCNEADYDFIVQGSGTCAAPALYSVTGGGAYCSGGAGKPVSLSNSEVGISYQLKNGASDAGSPVAGTGAAISFGNQTANGNYTVTATRIAGGCTSAMTGSATITVNPLPAVTINAGGPTTFCQGGAVMLTAIGANAYQWSNASTANPLSVNASGSLTVTGTDGNGCSATSAATVVTVNPLPIATISGAATICNGNSANLSITSPTGSSFTYSDGTTTSSSVPFTSGSALVSVSPSVNTAYTIASVTDGTCTNNAISGNAVITVNPVPNVLAAPASQTICNGAAIAAIAISGNVPNTVFTWTRNNTALLIGIGAGATGSSISGSLTNGATAPLATSFIITPAYTNAGVTCTGTAATAGVTVDASITPNPSVAPLYPMGGQKIQTIFLGYPGSAQSETINLLPTGGNGTYFYNWTMSGCNTSALNPSFANTTASYTFIPSASALCNGSGDNVFSFNIMVSDGLGCAAALPVLKRINVVNPFNASGKILVCHKVYNRNLLVTQMLTLDSAQVPAHLAHGDPLGNCTAFTGRQTAPAVITSAQQEEEQTIIAYPNPTTGTFTLELSSIHERADILVMDMQGKVLMMRSLGVDDAPKTVFNLAGFAAGMYFVQVKDGETAFRSRIVLQ